MNDSLGAQYITEFLGAGLFLFFDIRCLSALKIAGASLGLQEICIIWGLGTSPAVYLIAGISGAHLNPATTIALWLFACFPGRKVLPYSVTRIAGVFGGAMLAYLLYGNLLTEYKSTHQMIRGSLEGLQLTSIFSTYPAAVLSVQQAVLVKVVITSILAGMIIALTDDGDGVPKGSLASLLVDILVAVIDASTGPLTGFAVNPARDFGPKLFAWMAGWGDVAMTDGRDIPYFIVPIMVPIIGACAGATIHRYFIGKNLPCSSCKLEENGSQLHERRLLLKGKNCFRDPASWTA